MRTLEATNNGNNAINSQVEVENEMSDRQIEAITTGLGFTVKSWLLFNDPYKVMEQLEALEEKADEETRDTLHGIVSMIKQFEAIYKENG